MCKRGTDETVRVKITAERSHTGKAYWRDMPIDKCIAPIVRALQEGGINMNGSCCGHGSDCEGSILLADGRTLIILEPEEARAYHYRAEAKRNTIRIWIRGLQRDLKRWPLT